MKKKSEKFLAKKAEKRKAAQEALKRVPIRSEKSPIEHPRWIRIGAWIVGTLIVGAIGFVSSVYQIAGGPPWSVPPLVEPGEPDFSSAFAVPFSIKNRSAAFSLRNVKIGCVMNDVRTEGGSELHLAGITKGGSNVIEPLTARPYKCAFPFTGTGIGKILFAKVSIRISYSYSFIGEHTDEIVDGPFTWDTTMLPPRWIKGDFLK